MSSTAETTPLLPQYQERTESSNTSPRESRPSRTVTFNPLTTVSTYNNASTSNPDVRPLHAGSLAQNVAGGQNRSTGLSALNSKLRRRPSQGPPLTSSSPSSAPKVGPQRTTKKAQKLKLLPDPVTAAEEEEGVDGDFPRDVYSQITRIKEPKARSHAARLGKADRDRLPRVSAYCTANSYRLDGVIRFLKSRSKTRGANPKLYDECVYSPYDYEHEDKQQGGRVFANSGPNNRDVNWPPERAPGERRYSDSAVELPDNNLRKGDLIDLQNTESHDDV
ncbi:sporulation protein rmd1, partial [Elasticomyces elasticus]